MATHASTNTLPFVCHFKSGLVILASGQNCQEAEDLAMDYASETGLTPKGEEPFLTDWLTWEEAVNKYPNTNLDLSEEEDDDAILAIIVSPDETPATPTADQDDFAVPDADVFITPDFSWAN